MKYRTLIISDTHIGSDESNFEGLLNFIRENDSDTLILNGDIIDIKYLKSLKSKFNAFELIDQIVRIKKDTKIIYLKGNHDFDIEDYISSYDNLEIRDTYEHLGLDNKKYFALHGHKYIFNNFVADNRITERFISWVITILNKLKKVHSGRIFKRDKQLKKGLEYYTLSDDSRSFIKLGLKIISSYREKIKITCKKLSVDGIICGHIHLPEIKTISGKFYMNSGDFVENFSALVENYEGKWKIIYNYENKIK